MLTLLVCSQKKNLFLRTKGAQSRPFGDLCSIDPVYRRFPQSWFPVSILWAPLPPHLLPEIHPFLHPDLTPNSDSHGQGVGKRVAPGVCCLPSAPISSPMAWTASVAHVCQHRLWNQSGCRASRLLGSDMIWGESWDFCQDLVLILNLEMRTASLSAGYGEDAERVAQVHSSTWCVVLLLQLLVFIITKHNLRWL